MSPVATAVGSRPLLVIVIEPDVKAHFITVAQQVAGLGIFKLALAKADLQLPATLHLGAHTVNIAVLTIGPLHCARPPLTGLGVVIVIPDGEPASEIKITVTAVGVVRVVGIVIVAVIERIHDNLDGVIFPKRGVGIVGIDNIILNSHADIKMILILGQPKGETGILRAVPSPVSWKIKDPGIVARSHRDPLKAAVLSGRGLTIELHRAISHLWHSQGCCLNIGPRAL